MEYILWGTAKGKESWQEDIIAVRSRRNDLEPARQWAIAQGFTNIRVSTYNGEAPDFRNVLA